VKPKNTTSFKKKKKKKDKEKGNCSLVARLGILLEIAQMRSGSQIRRNQ
jgi:hypothetical protein